MKPEYATLFKLEAQRLLLMLRIKELETGVRPSLDDLFPNPSVSHHDTVATVSEDAEEDMLHESSEGEHHHSDK